MDSLDLIRTFREVASHGSFSQAAKKLDMSKATVSKYVAELETRFGVRLLNRSTRSVSLTDAGQLLLDRSTPVLEMVELTQAELQDRASQPAGRLRISAPHGMGNGEFPNLLADFMRYYPDVSISLQLTNRTVDLAEEGIDVDIRSGPVEDANLIVRKLRLMQMVVCASPIYWKKHGKPEHPRDWPATRPSPTPCWARSRCGASTKAAAAGRARQKPHGLHRGRAADPGRDARLRRDLPALDPRAVAHRARRARAGAAGLHAQGHVAVGRLPAAAPQQRRAARAARLPADPRGRRAGPQAQAA
jgi:DNA-binding transcriptional LysR family regulator